MIITCPNCSTRFSLADDALGDDGRKLRCTKCGHVWHQSPDDVEADDTHSHDMGADDMGAESADARRPEVVFEAEPEASSEPEPPLPPKREPYTPADLPAEAPPGEVSETPRSPPPSSDIPLEMAPGESEGAGPMDVSRGDAALPLESSPESLAESEMDDLEQMDAALRRELDKLDAPAGDYGGGAEVDDGDTNDPELSATMDDALTKGGGDTPQDPIPGVFTGPRPAAGRRRGGALKVLVALLLIVGGLGAGAWFGRDEIVRSFPEAAVVYEAAGIPLNVPGIGLNFRDVASERVIEADAEHLIVRGAIANISDKARPVPMIRLALFDSTDAEIQSVIAQPPRPELEPGQSAEFNVKLDFPSAAARRFEVSFVEGPRGE